MSNQVSKLSKINSNDFLKPLTWEDRKINAINFIKRNPGCSISDMVRSKESQYIGAKKTIEKITNELDDEGVVTKKEKDRINSRNYRMYVIKDNPMEVIPNQLKGLEFLFMDFTEKLIKIYSKPHSKWPNQKHLSDFPKPDLYKVESKPLSGITHIKTNFSKIITHHYIYERLTLYKIIQIPFIIIDFINASIRYSQLVIWINYNERFNISLNKMVFLKMNDLNQTASNIIKQVIREPYKYPDSCVDLDYFTTVENIYKTYSLFEKISLIRHTCKSIGLLDEMDKILNCIIGNNEEYFSRLYDSAIISEIPDDDMTDFIEIDKHKRLEIIHDMYCPGLKCERKNESVCDILDKDPAFML